MGSYYLPFETVKASALVKRIPLLKGELKDKEVIRIAIEDENDWQDFLSWVARKEAIIQYRLYVIDADVYKIDETIDSAQYGRYANKMRKLIDAHNEEVEKYQGEVMALVLGTVIEGFVYRVVLRNEAIPAFEQPDVVLETLEESIEGLDEVFYQKQEQYLFDELKEKRKQLKPFEKEVLTDHIFAACTTKGARLLRMKEIAEEMMNTAILTMTKTDLEAYGDLLMIKAKHNEQK